MISQEGMVKGGGAKEAQRAVAPGTGPGAGFYFALFAC